MGAMRAILCVQCFPPLLKQAGGVAKDNLVLCRALIELGWTVTIVTPVDVARSGDPEVSRWLDVGMLKHVPVSAVRGWSRHGIGTFLDLFSLRTLWALLRELQRCKFDVCFVDDVLGRLALLLLARGFGLPTVASTHTDVTGHASYRDIFAVRLTWYLHVLSAFAATVHATVSTVFAATLRSRYRAPVHAVWPPVLWSAEFLRPPGDFVEQGRKERARWAAHLGFTPRAVLLFAGRWSEEKRVELLMSAVPAGCALVIVGDGDTACADELEAARRRDVLPLRRSLDAIELRAAYAASDFLVSASSFETLGNVVAEALAAELPVVVQPAGGHLELVQDGVNSYFVDFEDPASARARLDAIVQASLEGSDGGLRAELRSVGARLRSQDVPDRLRAALVEPALLAAEAWRRRGILEWGVRLCCLLLFVVVWLANAVVTRALYAFSTDPHFRYLPAGTALETERVAWA